MCWTTHATRAEFGVSDNEEKNSYAYTQKAAIALAGEHQRAVFSNYAPRIEAHSTSYESHWTRMRKSEHEHGVITRSSYFRVIKHLREETGGATKGLPPSPSARARGDSRSGAAGRRGENPLDSPSTLLPVV